MTERESKIIDSLTVSKAIADAFKEKIAMESIQLGWMEGRMKGGMKD